MISHKDIVAVSSIATGLCLGNSVLRNSIQKVKKKSMVRLQLCYIINYFSDRRALQFFKRISLPLPTRFQCQAPLDPLMVPQSPSPIPLFRKCLRSRHSAIAVL